MHLPADLEISVKREITVAAPFKKSLTLGNLQDSPTLFYAILPLNTTQTSELHLQKTSWQSKLQKLCTPGRNNLRGSIPARSLLVNALWRMVCYMCTAYFMSLTTKPCTEKSCMRTTITLQLDTLDKPPLMNSSAETTGGKECEKQFLDTWPIVIPVQESNLYVMHLMGFSNLYRSLLPVGVQYPWISLQASQNLDPNSMMRS